MRLFPKAFSKAAPKVAGKLSARAFEDTGLKSGCPLEDHPFWELVFGPESRLCWDRYGLEILATKHDTHGGNSMVQFRGLTGVTAKFNAQYAPTLDMHNVNWTLPFAKAHNPENFVGVRINRDSSNNLVWQVVERKNDSWKPVLEHPVGEMGDTEVIIRDSAISVFVNGSLVLEEPHEVTGDGVFGIQANAFDSEDQVLLVGYRASLVLPLAPFRFHFTENSPDPSNFKVTYASSANRWWIDGVEYSSGETAALTPDDGSVEHILEVEDAEITEIAFANARITGTIDDMQDWPVTGSVIFDNCDLTGDITKTGWALTGTASFYNTSVNGDIAQTGWPLTVSAMFSNTAVTGDIAQTGWALTAYVYFNGTTVTGDLAQTGWTPNNLVRLQGSQINACSAPLSGWSSTDLNFSGCPLDQAAVDNILVGIDQEGQTDGVLNVSGTADPSQIGLDAIASLESKGWTVTYGAVSDFPVEDEDVR